MVPNNTARLAAPQVPASTGGEVALSVVERQKETPPVDSAFGGLTLSRNFIWTLAGNLGLAACQWGVLIVIAKLSDASTVGDFALAFALTAPVMLMAGQGLRALLATDSKRQIAFQDYLGYRLATAALGFLIVCLFLKTGRDPLLILIVAASKSLDSVSDIIYGLFQSRDRMDLSATSMLSRGVLSVVLVGALMLTGSVVWAAMGLALATMAVLIGYDCRHALRFLRPPGQPGGIASLALLQPAFHKPVLRKLAGLGIPLGVGAFLNSFSTNMPRYSLEHYAGPAMLGIFAANVYFVSAGNTVVNAMAQASVARLALLHHQGRQKQFSALFRKLVLFAVGLGAAGIGISAVFGTAILRTLYRPEYATWSSVFTLAMVAAAIGYVASFGGIALTAVRSITIQPVILAGCVVVAYLLCIVLVPRFNITGAAWVLLLTNVFQLAATMAAFSYARRTRSREVLAPSPA
jgi:O-antigen/teichoic acid export membrane protein